MDKQVEKIIKDLRKQAHPGGLEGMAKFGINIEKAIGVRIPNLRKIAKKLGRDHKLATALWKTGIHDARILASMVDEISKVTGAQMERWVKAFNSWDLCDQVCMNLFGKTEHAEKKAIEWTGRDEEFIKRGGFALIAVIAWQQKDAPDSVFRKYFKVIAREATDERNFVKKAVNWALRQIGKKTPGLNKSAIACARRIEKIDSRAARWIARDAIRELEGKAVQDRLKKISDTG